MIAGKAGRKVNVQITFLEGRQHLPVLQVLREWFCFNKMPEIVVSCAIGLRRRDTGTWFSCFRVFHAVKLGIHFDRLGHLMP
jgi:hypothetical protein